MPGSAAAARFALTACLLLLAGKYAVDLALGDTSTDDDVARAYKKVLLKVHPDKGGDVADMQELQRLKDDWDDARKSAPRQRPGPKAKPRARRPPPAGDLAGEPGEDGFRIRSRGVLLTYNSVRDYAQWERFAAHVAEHIHVWEVRNWAATLETGKNERLHIHLMVQFSSSTDTTSRRFAFESLIPQAEPNTLLGDGFCRRRIQDSLDRGMFYVWADKVGTHRTPDGRPCRAGNYEPAWTNAARTYAVKGKWADSLWKAHKLEHSVYEEYVYSCRDGVVSRKRNLDAVREREAQTASVADIETRVARIRSNPALFRPFPHVAAAAAWLARFASDALRYPLLFAVGPSGTGKTEWAKSLFRNPLELKIGALACFPERMRSFQRGVHDGIVLDDVRDLHFVINNQDKLQGKYDAEVEFASTQGGHLSYKKDLFAIPIVITANLTTENLDYLDVNDFLGNESNRVVVRFPVWPAPPAGGP